MHKYSKLKTSREFFKKDFPENLLPIRKISKKDKRLLQEKIPFLIRIKKRIKKLEKVLQIKKKQGILNKTYPYLSELVAQDKNFNFLFSSDQIKYDFLRKQSQSRTFSDYLVKVKEKKKFSLIYGKVSRKFFQKAHTQAQKNIGRYNENLLIQFETRLDVVLFRICFFKTLASAKQSINHNLVLINGRPVNIPSYQVKPGDIITINHKKKKVIANFLLNFLKNKLPKRRFRYLISTKLLDKKVGRTNTNQIESSISTRNHPTILNKKSLNNLINILKNSLNNINKRNNSSRIIRRLWLIECIAKLAFLSKISIDRLFFLKVKKLMYRKPSQRSRFSAMSIKPTKPLNIEVSYKLMSAIVLFSPQKLVFPATLNVDLLSRAIVDR